MTFTSSSEIARKKDQYKIVGDLASRSNSGAAKAAARSPRLPEKTLLLPSYAPVQNASATTFTYLGDGFEVTNL